MNTEQLVADMRLITQRRLHHLAMVIVAGHPEPDLKRDFYDSLAANVADQLPDPHVVAWIIMMAADLVCGDSLRWEHTVIDLTAKRSRAV